jgi:hypothetical protein
VLIKNEIVLGGVEVRGEMDKDRLDVCILYVLDIIVK